MEGFHLEMVLHCDKKYCLVFENMHKKEEQQT